MVRKLNIARWDTVLFDLDGVLVNNVTFDSEIENCFVENISIRSSLSTENARSIWDLYKANQINNRFLYNWEYHARVFGFETDFVRLIHRKAQSLLKPYPNANDLLSALVGRRQAIVVTDATRWVAEFKLKSTGLYGLPHIIISQDEAESCKVESKFWSYVLQHAANFIYLENRKDRIWKYHDFCKGPAVLVCQDEHLHRQKGNSKNIPPNAFCVKSLQHVEFQESN